MFMIRKVVAVCEVMLHGASCIEGFWVVDIEWWGSVLLQLQEIADSSTIASNEVTMAAPCVGGDSCYGGFVLA